MLKKFRKGNQKGFTLIELLIVVAIIGILAAIAIPQFASYRQKAFNSAALSDVRNIATGQESLFADSQGYGSVETTAGGAVLAPAVAVAAASLQSGPLQGATGIAAGAYIVNTLGTVSFSLSNDVTVGTICQVTAAPVVATTYTLAGKHLQGDSTYARESESTSMYRGVATAAGLAAATAGPTAILLATDIAASTVAIDYTAALGQGGYVYNPM